MALQVQLDTTSISPRRGGYTACVCAWCGTKLVSHRRVTLSERLAALVRPVSHGLCQPCKARLERGCAAIH